MSRSISLIILKKFSPLNRIADQHLTQLQASCSEKQVPAGAAVLKGKADDSVRHFLISGKLEIRRSFHERAYIDTDSVEAIKALENEMDNSRSIKAMKPCRLLVVPTALMEQLLAWNEDDQYKIAHFEDGESALDLDIAIDDSYEDDWTDLFLKSPLATNLNAVSIQNLFRQLEDIEVKAKQVVIKQNTNPDYFYIIKRGKVNVITDPHGPFGGKPVELGVGDYFGDEALIADALRNASVEMLEDGVLGRLEREPFDAIVRGSLINPITEQQLTQLDDDVQCIDVRIPAEFRFGHREKSRNIPIMNLRKLMKDLNPKTKYVLAPEGDRRSELGAYLLRQAGFDAYCLTSS